MQAGNFELVCHHWFQFVAVLIPFILLEKMSDGTITNVALLLGNPHHKKEVKRYVSLFSSCFIVNIGIVYLSSCLPYCVKLFRSENMGQWSLLLLSIYDWF